MRLTSLLSSDSVSVGLKSRTLGDAVREMLLGHAKLHKNDDAESLIEAVAHRESQASTALESGIAIPHARVDDINDFYLLVGVPEQPLETTCLDGSQVRIIFLVLANTEKHPLLLQIMACLAGLKAVDGLMDNIVKASSGNAVWELLKESNLRIGKALHASALMLEATVIATEDMSLSELLDAFLEQQVHMAPVCGPNGQFIGAVTSAEVLDEGFPDYMSRFADVSFLDEYKPFIQFFAREHEIRVGELVNKEPLVVEAHEPLIHVVFRMMRQRERYAFVLESGRFLGYLDRDDILLRVFRA